MPVKDPTVTAVLVVLHIPPLVPSLNVVEVPGHTFIVPVMATGAGLTVIGKLTEQPAPIE
jgi:hypothetical protein